MDLVRLQIAMNEAERFLDKARFVRVCHKDVKWGFSGSKATGACRRASLDLTRALAELRK